MSFFPKKETPKETPKEIPKEKPGEASLFEKKKEISRREFREKLRKAPSHIPGTTRKYYKEERVELEKEVFGKKYGSHITGLKYKKALQELGRERNKAKTRAEKLEIDRKVRYLEEFREAK